jgi:uncharacterized membrane protein
MIRKIIPEGPGARMISKLCINIWSENLTWKDTQQHLTQRVNRRGMYKTDSQKKSVAVTRKYGNGRLEFN